ncbi:MAG: hypothetical protein AAB229_07735 [Candidatus Hydrogenedentota bacterium]
MNEPSRPNAQSRRTVERPCCFFKAYSENQHRLVVDRLYGKTFFPHFSFILPWALNGSSSGRAYDMPGVSDFYRERNIFNSRGSTVLLKNDSLCILGGPRDMMDDASYIYPTALEIRELRSGCDLVTDLDQIFTRGMTDSRMSDEFRKTAELYSMLLRDPTQAPRAILSSRIPISLLLDGGAPQEKQAFTVLPEYEFGYVRTQRQDVFGCQLAPSRASREVLIWEFLLRVGKKSPHGSSVLNVAFLDLLDLIRESFPEFSILDAQSLGNRNRGLFIAELGRAHVHRGGAIFLQDEKRIIGTPDQIRECLRSIALPSGRCEELPECWRMPGDHGRNL